MSDRDVDFQSLTRAVREGTIPWSREGFIRARTVVHRARSGQLELPHGAVPAELLETTPLNEVALGLWLRSEYGAESPEVPAAHHLRFHAIEHFLERYADLLIDEGLVRAEETRVDDDQSREDSGHRPELDPSPLLLGELTTRPYDSPLSASEAPGFDPVAVLKAVARRVREADG
jgi:hypothetical protein